MFPLTKVPFWHRFFEPYPCMFFMASDFAGGRGSSKETNHMAVVVKTVSVPFWGGCTTHFRTYFSGDWDVPWGYGGFDATLYGFVRLFLDKKSLPFFWWLLGKDEDAKWFKGPFRIQRERWSDTNRHMRLPIPMMRHALPRVFVLAFRLRDWMACM